MNKYYYQKKSPISGKVILRVFGLALVCVGLFVMVYIFSPLLIWQFTLAPAFAESQITIPIPQHTLVTPATITSLVHSTMQSLSGVDFNNVQNWYPGYNFKANAPRETSYFLTIPKLKLANAFVSSVDTDLSKHLVSLAGTGIPPEKGNTVIFGHSTLPQLFNPNDYKTIFATAHTLQLGDEIQVIVDNVTYTYTIISITVVDPDDTSVLSQQYDDSYLTLITCTPPGTTWQRLIIKSRLKKIQG